MQFDPVTFQLSAVTDAENAEFLKKLQTATMIGFIGCGKMAEAMVRGFIHAEILPSKHIIASVARPTSMERVEKMGIAATTSNVEVVQKSDVVFLAVKPHLLGSVLKEVHPVVDVKKHLVMSVAAGVSLSTIGSYLPKQTKIIRCMPNTPCLVQKGATVYAPNAACSREDLVLANTLLKSCGMVLKIAENSIDGFGAMSGSGPAYVFLMIEALADGAVKVGVPRSDALQFAAQTVIGAGNMVLETGKHPGQLKDEVCSPGGTTIQAVAALERGGFRSSVIEAVQAAFDRTLVVASQNASRKTDTG